MKFFLLFVLFFARAYGETPKLYLIHIVPRDTENHTVGDELRVLKEAFAQGMKRYLKAHSHCRIDSEIIVRQAGQEDLYETAKEVAHKSGKIAMVGFPRSTLARLVAKAAAGTSRLGISVGAATDELRSINRNFISMGTPISSQWPILAKDMKTNCPSGVQAVFDPIDYYSRLYQTKFHDSKLWQAGNVSDFQKTKIDEIIKKVAKVKCVFLAMNIATSHALLTSILGSGWSGHIYGSGDWSYYSTELKRSLGTAKSSKVNIILPTAWNTKKDSADSQDPVVAYTIDATILAAHHLCTGFDPTKFSPRELAKLHLLRHYTGIGEGGNYLVPANLIRY